MPEARESKLKRFIKPAGLVLFSGAVIWLLFMATGVAPSQIIRTLSGANVWIFIFVVIFSVFWHVFVGADKLFRVLGTLGASGGNVSFKAVLRMRLGSGPFRVFLPLDAGDILSVLYLWRGCGAAPDAASGAVIFDRGLNFLGTGFWLMIGLGLWGPRPEAGRAGLAMIFAGAYFLFLFLPPAHDWIVRAAGKISIRAGKVSAAVLSPFSSAGFSAKLFFVAYGIVFQVRPLVICYLLFGAFGIWLPVSQFIAPACLCVLAGHVPSAAGIGPREAAFLVFFSKIAPAPVLLSVGILQSLTVHVIPMLSGAPWILWYISGLRGKGRLNQIGD